MMLGFLTTLFPVVAAIAVAVLTYFLTKRKEREADWRKLKFDLYRDYMNAVAGITEGRMTPESETRYPRIP
jgi:protein-S-isoprenylcysteine O-methyltransferase Ste14